LTIWYLRHVCVLPWHTNSFVTLAMTKDKKKKLLYVSPLTC